MKAEKKQRKIKFHTSFRMRLFISFIALILLLLTILWVFQTMFINSFYKRVKVFETDEAANTIADYIDSANLSSLAAAQSVKKDVTITVLDENLETVCSAESRQMSIFKNISSEQARTYISKARESEDLCYNEYFSGFNNSDNPPPGMREADGGVAKDGTLVSEKDKNTTNSVNRHISYLAVQLTTGSDGKEYAIFVSASITPVDSVVTTLRYILILASAVMIAVALITAAILANSFSKPIKKINEKAMTLAEGKYDKVSFEGSSIKEINNLSESLNHMKTELGKIDNLQKELIANISHDLRTPLTLISGYAEVMRDIPGEANDENLQVIIDESNRLSSLVSDVLDISKLNAGIQEMNFEIIDLTACIHTVILRYNKLIQNEGYKIILETGAKEEVFVKADRTRLLQVVYNLINNAVSYTGEDKTVKINVITENNFVTVHIIDSGEGIPAEKLPYIWDRYYKAETAHRRARQGSGLGLSIVKDILELHSAEYGVSSKEGEGSDFWFKMKTEEK